MLDSFALQPASSIADFRIAGSRRSAKPVEGAFGPRMASHLRPDADHPIEMQTLRKPQLVVTRLRCETGLTQVSTPLPSERAFLVNLQLRELPFHELWLDGGAVPTGLFARGAVSIVDVADNPTVFLPTPFDCLQFYISRTELDRLADESGCRRIQALSWARGEVDAVTGHLGRAFLPALARPEQPSGLFLDHAALALTSHFAHAYGGMAPPELVRGGLAPWQERRAKEIMRDRVESEVSLADLAVECRLSRSYFARAFKKTTGETPHRWLLLRRVDTAKQMMTQSDMSLAEVALAVGFSDQSHMTKVFSRAVGATPGAWRRAMSGTARAARPAVETSRERSVMTC